LQYILHYSSKGELLNIFGGRGESNEHFDNAHGICIDTRVGAATLLITDRMNLPGAYICRPVIHGEHVYFATIWSGDGGADTGFVSILDKNNQLISAPGGSTPRYENGENFPTSA